MVELVELLRIYAEAYVETGLQVDTSIKILETANIWEDVDHQTNLLIIMQRLGEICVSGELPVTRKLVDKIINGLTEGRVNPQVAKYFDNKLLTMHLWEIRNRFVAELSTKVFIQLHSSRQPFFDSPRNGWEEVIKRFGGTVSDIEEMSQCFALSRYAACVFHSLQVIEAALIDLGTFLEVVDPKSGWTAISSRLDVLVVKTKYTDLPPKFQEHFAFLEQLQGTVLALKNAWRNKISHAHGKLVLLSTDFKPDVAEEIMLATRAFMRRLATEMP
jgi:hypothetical protein